MASTHPLVQPSCANPECRASGQPLHACSNCRLVLYCRKLCQKRHWKYHKTDCRSPLSSVDWRPQYKVENREPSWKNWEPADEEQRKFVERFERHNHCMYRDLPPIDVLNLPNNEGSNVESMNILFATSGDLSTLMKTIINLPANASPHLRIVLNDKDESITVRNLILLLLAISSKDDLVTAECAVHFWYSQFMPEWCFSVLGSQVLPLLRDVPMFPGAVSDALSKEGFGPGVDDVQKMMCLMKHVALLQTINIAKGDFSRMEAEFLQYYSKTWKHGRAGSLKMEVNRKLCCLIFLTISPSSTAGIPPNTVDFIMTHSPRMKPWDGKYKNRDDWDNKLDMVTPARRVAVKTYYEETVVLPFGHYHTSDWHPNANFYPHHTHDTMRIISDPLSGWDIDEVAEVDNGGAQNDIYGKLFYHVRNQFKLFVSRLRTLKVDIEIYCNDAKALPAVLSDTKFDRIVISDLTDDPVWDTQRMIQVLSPMLKDKSVNRHACVVEEKQPAQGGASGQRST